MCETPNHDRADMYYESAKEMPGDPLRFVAWECALKANALDVAEIRIREIESLLDETLGVSFGYSNKSGGFRCPYCFEVTPMGEQSPCHSDDTCLYVRIQKVLGGDA